MYKLEYEDKEYPSGLNEEDKVVSNKLSDINISKIKKYLNDYKDKFNITSKLNKNDFIRALVDEIDKWWIE